MWSKWKQLSEVQRSQYVLGGLAVLILVGVMARSNTDQDKVPVSLEMPAEAQMDAPADPYEALSADPQQALGSGKSNAGSLPPTAVVDGVTYSGEEQIEALTQAARDAGLNEMEARRTGQETAILCNGNPDCLR